MNTERSYRVLAVVGSLRERSYNLRLARWVAANAPDELDVRVYRIGDIPLYDADVEAQGDPEGVIDLKRAIADADAVLILTPEYNGGIPGVLKNALDWASRPPRPLRGQPVAVMGASPGRWGTVRAQSDLQGLVRALGMIPLPTPDVMIDRAASKIDEDGDLVDEETADRVRGLLDAFAEWIDRVQQRSQPVTLP